MRLRASASGASPRAMRWAKGLDDGRLADARLSDEHRVVLGPPGEDANDAPDLTRTAHHGIELALAGHCGEVAGELVEQGCSSPSCGFALAPTPPGVPPNAGMIAFLALFGLRFAQKADCGSELLVVDADAREMGLEGRALLARGGDDEMLGADIVGAGHVGFFRGPFEQGPRASS